MQSEIAPRFADPVELEVARIFDEHGIEWEYVEALFRQDIERLASRWRLRGLEQAARARPEIGPGRRSSIRASRA
jgi:hypothetical protein